MIDGFTYGTFSLGEAPENLFCDDEREIAKALKHHFSSGVVTYRANKYMAELLLGGVPIGIYSFVERRLRDKKGAF